MYRIILSVDDLTRIRIAERPLPIIETIFAFEALNAKNDIGFQDWRRRVRGQLIQLGPRADRIARLPRVAGDYAELLDHCINTGRSDVTLRDATVAPEVRHLLAAEDFSAIAVAPYWERIRAHLDAARELMRDVMWRDGVGALLNGLGPGIRWNAPALEISGVGAGELRPGGCGIVLAPSLFLQRAGHVVGVDPRDPQNAPFLVFPVRPRPEDLPGLLTAADLTRKDCRRAEPDRLAALVGRTRAAALRELREGCSNIELAERLGVTTAAVSQHTAILRAAGLILTERKRGQAVHTLTPLGRQLLRGGSVVAHPPLPTVRFTTRQPTSV
ncbi:ArsR/SmtB family transcription factor [Streptomyces rugosispiralis]|uniref:Winged helix-turn-helix transcriptional regulator n=1 Tax=Streptomyces rugosispiralis TaxID=2967341 RepID=A0ABT1VAX4_9ACTN|nr:HTH domain-containing protein [Streptomyces rugosispiralis]MCQ8194422.1 winged helix-turn-helix transcriptional regulator [Streptomyces rugosispiralis]